MEEVSPTLVTDRAALIDVLGILRELRHLQEQDHEYYGGAHIEEAIHILCSILQLDKEILDDEYFEQGSLTLTSNDKEHSILEARLKAESNRQAARWIGVPRRTVDRTVKRVIKRAEEAGAAPYIENSRLLFLDIETAPMLSYLWRFWSKTGASPNMQEDRTYVMSWAAKWAGDNQEVMTNCLFNVDGEWARDENDLPMLEDIWQLLDKADFVVAHNGDNFDIKYLNTEFLLAGMQPPSPYKQIDTLKAVRRCFRIDSNKLSYLVPLVLQRPAAKPKDGFETWRRCLLGDPAAWEELVAYNKQDVIDLEDIYLTVRGWDKSHPSITTAGDHEIGPELTCPTCGSEDIEPTDRVVTTNVSRFEHFRCNSCGANLRGRNSIISPKERTSILMRAR